MKKCKKCNQIMPKSNFGSHPGTADKLKPTCKSCTTIISNNYKKSKSGLPSRMFNNQKVNSKRRGMPLPNYSIKEFKDWVKNQPNFNTLYNNWVKSNYNRLLVPSCDRIDDKLPYTLDNITLMTWEENKAKGHKMIRDNELHNSTLLNGGHSPVEKWSKDKSLLICTYISQAEAARKNPKVHQANIHKVCVGKLKTTGGFHWKYSGSTKTK